MYTPRYTISNSILRHIGTIEASREVIDHAPLLPFYEKQFQKDAMVRAVHHGTHIEGNALDLNQAEQAMFGKEVIARQRDVQEVINYRRVMEYIGEFQGEKKVVLDTETVKHVHTMTVEKILDPDRQGKFRKTQVVIKNSLTGEVSFTPPPAVVVEQQVTDLFAYIKTATNEDIHPVLKSGIVHYELVRIHPFVDGNGRVARAISTLILFTEGYDIRKFFSLEEYFDSDPTSYYQALQSVTKREGDLTFWLEYFTEGLAIELAKIKQKVERISVDANLRERLGGAPLLLSERQLELIEYIQKTGFLQNSAFKQLFPFVSEDTVLNDLKVLIKAGIIKKHGVTKAAKYVMNK